MWDSMSESGLGLRWSVQESVLQMVQLWLAQWVQEWVVPWVQRWVCR